MTAKPDRLRKRPGNSKTGPVNRTGARDLSTNKFVSHSKIENKVKEPRFSLFLSRPPNFLKGWIRHRSLIGSTLKQSKEGKDTPGSGPGAYLWAATARLFRYFWAVMTPMKRKPEAASGLAASGSSPRNPSTQCTLAMPRIPQPPAPTLRLWAAFFSSVALGKMSLEARMKPRIRPSSTLNHALRLRPAIAHNLTNWRPWMTRRGSLPISRLVRSLPPLLMGSAAYVATRPSPYNHHLECPPHVTPPIIKRRAKFSDKAQKNAIGIVTLLISGATPLFLPPTLP